MIDDWQGNTAVCTSVFGAHDYIGEQIMIDGVDYHYITDGLADPSPSFGWHVWHPDLSDFKYDDRRKSKIAKIYPYAFDFLEKYKYLIWIDGDMQIINANFVPEVLSHLNHGLVMSPHFDGRDCAYGEASIRPAKYKNEPISEQVDFYKSEGFPEHAGLYECGVMARDMTNEAVKKVAMLWMEQNLTWSYQDQVSFPYSIWKLGYKPDLLPQSFRNYNWVLINAHRRED